MKTVLQTVAARSHPHTFIYHSYSPTPVTWEFSLGSSGNVVLVSVIAPQEWATRAAQNNASWSEATIGTIQIRLDDILDHDTNSHVCATPLTHATMPGIGMNHHVQPLERHPLHRQGRTLHHQR